MKKFIFVIILLFSFLDLYSQNMVINHSFEDTLYLPEHIYDDNIMNCLCDRGTNQYMIFPAYDRHKDCIGWYNMSFGTSKSIPAYYNQDVDSTHSNFEARQVDVPINHGNAYDHSANPLVPRFLTPASDGIAYVGLCIKRFKATGNNYAHQPYTEMVGQTLINPDTSNYLKEGYKYDVSFKVAKGEPGTMFSGHSLKRVSALFWDAPMVVESSSGYRANELQKKYFMVNAHSNPSGYLTSNYWQTVQSEFIAEKDLKYMGIGVFDINIDWNDHGNNLIPDSLITPINNGNTYHQEIYYYVDDVKVIPLGKANTCDCEDLVQDIKLIATHSNQPGLCCIKVYVKIEGQEGACRINELRWRGDINGTWSKINLLNDLGVNRIADSIYVPIKTICADKSYDGDSVNFQFEFRTLGGTFGCQTQFKEKIDCQACPCDWTQEPIEDPYDSTLNAIRIESNYIGRDSANNCCFDISFINNTAIPITADKIRLGKFNGLFTNFTDNSDLDLEYIDKPFSTEWLIPSGEIAPYDTLNLATICIGDSSSILLYWDLFLASLIDGKYVLCSGENIPTPLEISCSTCCPNTKLDFEIEKNLDGCCIDVNGINDGGCGNSYKYYRILDSVETLVNLPFTLCNDNSSYKLRVEILDENQIVICNKYYDFNDIMFDCSCCDNLIINVKEDKTYAGQDCKFIIDDIVNTNNCEFGANTTIEIGTVDSLGFTSETTLNFEDYSSWAYYLSGCESKTLRFNFIIDEEIVCSKEVNLKCQKCGDINIYFENSDYDSVLFEGHYNPLNCCIDIIFGDAPTGNCNYYGKIVYYSEDLPSKVDTADATLFGIETNYDTIQVCTPYPDPEGPVNQRGNFTIKATVGIYDSDGNLMCSFNASRLCIDPANIVSPPKVRVDVNLDNRLVTNDLLVLDVGQTNYLQYKIYDINGKFEIGKQYLNFNTKKLEINVQTLKPGIHSISIETDNNSFINIFNIVR